MALEKAIIANTATGDRVAVLFNPDEYTLKKQINYAQAAVPGLIAPLLQFTHGGLQTLDMELLVDSYEQQSDVRMLTRKITDFMRIDAAQHAPPVLLFTWGSLTFTCVLASVSQRFIMFLPDGIPVRARLQVSFHEFSNALLEAKETKTETADFSKIHTVAQGESLSVIAGQVYENPAAWRPIALRNGILNPRKLTTGARLIVPQLPFRHPETGAVLT